MKQQFKTLLWRVMLLVIALASMTVLAASMIVAAPTQTHTLTLNFSPDEVLSCTVTIKDKVVGSTPEIKVITASGESVEVGDDYDVTVSIQTAVGKTAVGLVENSAITVTNNQFGLLGVSTAQSLTIKTENTAYSLKLLDHLAGNGVLYFSAADGFETLFESLKGGSVIYHMGDADVQLPIVKPTNDLYDFKGWYVKVGDHAPLSATKQENDAGTSEDDQYFIPSNLLELYSDNQDFIDHPETVIIYVYPNLQAKKFPITRYDYSYDSVKLENRGDYLGTISQDALYKSSYSALGSQDGDAYTFSWNGEEEAYRTYVGYLLREMSYDVLTVGSGTNAVVRFYDPIEYKLTYDLLGGTAGANAPTLYQFNQKLDISAPTRTGYDFAGWKIEVWAVINESTGEKGWKTVETTDKSFTGFVKIDPNGVADENPNAKYASLPQDVEGTDFYEIRMTANWSPKPYELVYDYAGGAASENTPDTYLYNQTLAIPDPTRVGYTFTGWTIEVWALLDGAEPTYGWKTVELTEKNFSFLENADPTQNEKYASLAQSVGGTDVYQIRMTATWAAESYNLAFEIGEGASMTGPASPITVTYDALLSGAIDPSVYASLIPTRTGYHFRGYWNADFTKCYLDETGAPVEGLVWDIDGGENASNVALFAKWEEKDYKIVINHTELSGVSIQITLSDGTILYSPETTPYVLGTEFTLKYGTTFTLTIGTPETHKVAKFDGKSVDDSDAYTVTLTAGSWDNGTTSWDALAYTFEALILQERAFAPTIADNVDYVNEAFKGLAVGTYRVTYTGQTEPYFFQITATENGSWKLREEWLGKIIELTWFGDDTNWSDSDPKALELAGRPAKPSIFGNSNPKAEISGVVPDDTFITVQMNILGNLPEGEDIAEFTAKFTAKFQFAIAKVKDNVREQDLVWQDSPIFENLEPGTAYTVYVRYRAIESEAPHGESFAYPCSTTIKYYIDTAKGQLDGMLGENPGEETRALIESAKTQIDAWKKDPTVDDFYARVEALLKEIEENAIKVAVAKDAAIRELRTLRDQNLATGFFSEENAQILKELFSSAEAAIKALNSVDDIENAKLTALGAMKAVKIHTLTQTDSGIQIKLESLLGLDQSTRLTLINEPSFEALARAVDQAIRTSGMVQVGGTQMSIADAEALLRTLDMLASYRFEMTTKPDKNERFTLRLQIPEHLKNATGLRVAYYDATTGTIELLESKVDETTGEIVFYASHIADFILLGDTTLKLEGVILSLGVVIFCQLICILALIILRAKSKNRVTHASVGLLPVSLAIYFTPVNGEWIALGMAIAVVILQIILMALLMSSNMIRLPKKRKSADKDSAEPSADAFAQTSEADAYAIPEKAADDAFTAFRYDTEEAEQTSQSDDGDDEILFDDEDYSDENGDFIEPAATTRYSLPDDDDIFEYADSEEESERAEDESYASFEDTEAITYDDPALYVYDDGSVDPDEVFYQDSEETEDATDGEENPYESEAEEVYDDTDAFDDIFADPDASEEILDEEEDPDSLYRYDE